MELNGSQQKQLQAALISAYPTRQDLEQMVFHGLDVHLGAITAEGGLEQAAFELLRWAVARGRLEELIKTAIEKNSGNQELQRVATILRMSSGQFPSDVPPAAALPAGGARNAAAAPGRVDPPPAPTDGGRRGTGREVRRRHARGPRGDRATGDPSSGSPQARSPGRPWQPARADSPRLYRTTRSR